MRLTRLLRPAVAGALALAVLAPTPAHAVGPTFSFHFVEPGGTVANTESFDPPGDKPIIGDFVGATDTSVGTADDIVWYTSGAGEDGIWRSTGDRGFASSPLSISGTYTPLVGSFAKDDAKEDILWLSAAGTSSLWDFNADGSITKTSLPTVKGTGTPLVGDFGGSSETDLILYREGTASDAHFRFNEGVPSVLPFSINGTYLPVLGAFGGIGAPTFDTKTDIFWYAPGAAQDSLWDFNNDGTITKKNFTVNGSYNVVGGAFTIDGAEDLLFYAPGSGADSFWDFNPNGTITKKTVAINGSYTVATCECRDAGEEHDDLFFFGPGTGADVLWDLTDDLTWTVRSWAGTNLDGAGIAGIGNFEDFAQPGNIGVAGIITYDQI